MLKVPLEMPAPAAVPSVQIIRAVLREYHAATHTAQVEPVLGPASLVGEIPVLMSCRPDLLTTGREVAVLTWPDVGGLVLGPHGAVPGDPPSADDADKVDGIHASATPTANKLLALNASSKLPASITGDADTVDSIHAAATPTANKLLAMNANAKFPTHTIEGDLTVEGSFANTVTRDELVPIVAAMNGTAGTDIARASPQGWPLGDLANCYCYGNFRVPSKYVSDLTIKALVYPSGTGNLYGSLYGMAGAEGEAYNTHTGSLVNQAVALVANQWKAILSISIGGLALGDYVSMYFRRRGDSGSDTVGATVFGGGFLVSYTASS